VSEGLARAPATIIGADAENPTRLTCYDWHTSRWIAWQDDVRRVRDTNGYWEVELARDGRYLFTLRQQPEEAPCPIQAPEARLRIGPFDQTKPVPMARPPSPSRPI